MNIAEVESAAYVAATQISPAGTRVTSATREGEHVVATIDSLVDGELREVDVDGLTLLLARDGDRVFATQPTCPHYGLKFAEGGAIVDGCLRCPWHMSRFRASDGVPLDPPAIDGLATYACRVENRHVIVEVPTARPPRGVTPPMSRVASSAQTAPPPC